MKVGHAFSKSATCLLFALTGTACAWSLARHPEKFDVHVWEALPVPGGVASSCTLRDGRVLNDQVQGGAPSYRHTLLLLEQVRLWRSDALA
jgi:uncharacterized protein with NAD-binding domain and iron-sulfur cluster